MGTLANSEDPDEMVHNIALNQGLYCLLKQNLSTDEEIQCFGEIITWYPSIYNESSQLNCITFLEISIGLKRSKLKIPENCKTFQNKRDNCP